jgi:hypothetical protein
MMTRDDHPGVLVVADGGRSISFSARGSLGDADRAVTLANRAVIAANDGKVKARVYGSAVRVPTGRYGLLGFLAGLGAGLGFLMPPRSRVTGARVGDIAEHRLPQLLHRQTGRAFAGQPDVHHDVRRVEGPPCR